MWGILISQDDNVGAFLFLSHNQVLTAPILLCHRWGSWHFPSPTLITFRAEPVDLLQYLKTNKDPWNKVKILSNPDSSST